MKNQIILTNAPKLVTNVSKHAILCEGSVSLCISLCVGNINAETSKTQSLWANVYFTDDIQRIDPKTGVVLGRIDMTGLLKESDKNTNTDVLNGIAYDEKTGKIYVTGKNWPKLFEIQVVEK